MRVKLTSEEARYLASTTLILAVLSEQRKSLLASEGTSFVLDISEDDADALRDRLGEELQREGLDEVYNPTPRGRVLEGLIDKLFVG